MVAETFATNNDVKNYPRTIRLYSKKEGTEHFPRVIPEESQDIRFKEWPAFMQGGSGIYLSYSIDESDIKEIDEEFRYKSKYVFNTFEEIKNAGERVELICRIRDAICNDGISNVCDDFTMYMLGAEKFSGAGYWNHGVEYGVVVNKDKMRIFYFYESW